MLRLLLAVLAVLALFAACVIGPGYSDHATAGPRHLCADLADWSMGDPDGRALDAPMKGPCAACETAMAVSAGVAVVVRKRVVEEEAGPFLRGITVRPKPFPPKAQRQATELLVT